MHRSIVVPGLPPVTALNSAVLPPSLSARLTVPAVNWVPGFEVVLENAENTPKPAREPAMPMTRSVSTAFWILLMLLHLLGRVCRPGRDSGGYEGGCRQVWARA